MRTKKYLALALAAMLTLGGFGGAAAEAAPVYTLGDKPADFTVTMSDGQELSLYKLLEEKQVVILNFWATWCGPCEMEFPFLQDAYTELSDKVGFIGLSIHDPDTNEVINEFKERIGLTTLPLGRDIGLADQYNVQAYPTTFIIDRNGVICLEHVGMITSTLLLTNALEMFLGDDYTDSVILSQMPELPFVEAGDAEALSKAANAPGGTLEFGSMVDEAGNMPFLPSEEGDCAVASNLDAQSTAANLIVSVPATQPGDVLAYEYLLKGLDYEDNLIVFMQGDLVNLHGVQTDGWAEGAVRVDREGVDSFMFLFQKGAKGGYDADCRIRNVRLLTGDEAAAIEIPEIPGPKVLPGTEMAFAYAPEEVTRLWFYHTDGSLVEEQGTDTYCITQKPVVELKIRVGRDVNLQTAGVKITTDVMDSELVMLRDLPFDDEAFIYTLEPSKAQLSISASLTADISGYEVGQSIMLFSSGEALVRFFSEIMSMFLGNATEEQVTEFMGGDAGYYGLEDGTLVADMKEVVQNVMQHVKQVAQQEAAQAKAYTVTFADPDGKPVAGVMAQFCDDSICAVQVSDENGAARYEGKPYPYDLHVLMVPAGYQPVEDVFKFPEEGGEIAITLTPLAP